MATGRHRIGILGGAFDPPHIGHLILGQTALEQLELERVLFMPTGRPPHKHEKSVTATYHRVAMTKLAARSNVAFEVSAIDVERPAPHYTSTLRPCVEEVYPGAHLVLIIGSDSLRDLPDWHEPRSVVQQWELAMLHRPGYIIDWEMLEAAAPGVRQATTLLDGPAVELSSTDIRRWTRAGRSLRYLLPPDVIYYIDDNRLYETGRAAPLR